jgi:wyosine [tRNA(Phe)-imidazoG37] synthetase (radical SAM superfamily)
MEKKTNTHIYGPVPSRRLGRSLGVDVVPLKVCSYDCVYCQLGSRGKPVLEKRPYIAANEILSQLSEKLKEGAAADVITIAGSGEPTLNSEIGALISGIKKMTDIPLVVLTNGSMLWDGAVRKSLMEADVVAPSLDAHSPGVFGEINRPHKALDFEAVLGGLSDFRKEYKGMIWLEIFILEGINDTPANAEKFLPHIRRIRPDKIHINTSARPPAEAFAKKASRKSLEDFRKILGEGAEIIASFKEKGRALAGKDLGPDILNMLARRPCTAADMADGLNAHLSEVLKYLEPLVEAQQAVREFRGKEAYYRPAREK